MCCDLNAHKNSTENVELFSNSIWTWKNMRENVFKVLSVLYIFFFFSSYRIRSLTNLLYSFSTLFSCLYNNFFVPTVFLIFFDESIFYISLTLLLPFFGCFFLKKDSCHPFAFIGYSQRASILRVVAFNLLMKSPNQTSLSHHLMGKRAFRHLSYILFLKLNFLLLFLCHI